jgi:hypothetical protein
VREDDTHPATAELLNDAVTRNGLSNHWRESYVWEKGQVNEGCGWRCPKRAVGVTSRLHSQLLICGKPGAVDPLPATPGGGDLTFSPNGDCYLAGPFV